MGQANYINESNLNGELTKLDENLYSMLDFAYLHEDMVNTINELMSEWGKENIPTYTSKVEEFNNLPDNQKQCYEYIDDWLSEEGRWWITAFDEIDDEKKKMFLQRYRLTISCCLHSSTYDYESLKEDVEKGWASITAN